MDWKPGDTLPLKPLAGDGPIIVATQDKKSQSYWYNVVFYYEPMGVWYGGPGIRLRREDIEYWSEIQDPKTSALRGA